MTQATRTPHVIVGAGIAGMFVAMQLYQRNEPFVILERTKHANNKLSTFSAGDTKLELGASVFLSTHEKLLQLINFCGLSSYIITLPRLSTTVWCDGHNEQYSIKTSTDKLRAYADQHRLATFGEACQAALNPDEYRKYKCKTGDWFERKAMNAHAFYATLDAEKDAEYLKLSCGLEEVIKVCWARFAPFLFVDTVIHQIHHNNHEYHITATQAKQTLELVAERCYLCVGLEHLRKLHVKGAALVSYVKHLQTMGQTQASMRVYVEVDESVLKDVGYVSGNVVGHWWIKVSPTVLLVYCDADGAERLNKYNNTKLLQRLKEELEVITQQPVVRLRILQRAWWKHAYTILTKSFFDAKTHHAPPPDGMACSAIPTVDGQAWMEGHLMIV